MYQTMLRCELLSKIVFLQNLKTLVADTNKKYAL